MADIEAHRSMSVDDLIPIYSMTKPITAAVMMTLVDEGRVGLDEPIARHVPELASMTVWRPDGPPTPARSPITLRRLLTHTAGFSYSFQTGTPVAKLYAPAGLVGGRWYHDPAIHGLDDVVRRLASLPLAFEPGEQWHYSMAIEVVGLIIERVCGAPLDRVFADRLLSPLGMKDTAFVVPPAKSARLVASYSPKRGGGLSLIEAPAASSFLQQPSCFSGSGGLVSTLGDYDRFAQMLAAGGRRGRTRILSATAVRAMMSDQLQGAQHEQVASAARFGYGGSGQGMGFGLGGAVLLDTAPFDGLAERGEYGWGGAASTTFWADPTNGVAVTFMTQLLPSGVVPIHDTLQRVIYQRLTG